MLGDMAEPDKLLPPPPPTGCGGTSQSQHKIQHSPDVLALQKTFHLLSTYFSFKGFHILCQDFKFSHTKSVCIRLCKLQGMLSILCISVNGTVLKVVQKVKLLGVLFDCRLQPIHFF